MGVIGATLSSLPSRARATRIIGIPLPRSLISGSSGDQLLTEIEGKIQSRISKGGKGDAGFRLTRVWHVPCCREEGLKKDAESTRRDPSL